MAEERYCKDPICGKLLIQRENEHLSHFLSRSHCDRTCSNRKERKKTHKKGVWPQFMKCDIRLHNE